MSGCGYEYVGLYIILTQADWVERCDTMSGLWNEQLGCTLLGMWVCVCQYVE